MRQSKLFTKTLKKISEEEQSINTRLLERGGFVYKNSAGIYTFLPLGWRVIKKIANLIREEMDAVGGQEMFMPALIDRQYLEATNRWDVPIGFEVLAKGRKESTIALGWTHEEVLTHIATKYINSYKDLPFAAYQIQTKFRNEPRVRSGLLRGREFIMKDLYSFHTSEDDLWRYYEEIKGAYHKIFHCCGLKAIYTLAAGGAFTVSNTHEFQVVAPVGEDTIFICRECEYAENKEISKLKYGDQCPKCRGKIEEERSIEVGNIFPLGTKYSEAFNLHFTDEKGQNKLVVMGSYGIGLGRLMGTVVEVHNDGKGIIWPETVAPFLVHLLALSGKKSTLIEKGVEKIYNSLLKEGIEVLYDDRSDVSAGVKFADSDLIGIPYRALVSGKTLKAGKIEVKQRSKKKGQLVDLKQFISKIKN